jgi:capsular polysaccharide biosynthesis protein
MSQQPLNLRRTLQILRRHRITFGLIVMLGLLAGAVYAVLNPPMYVASALVALPASNQTGTAQALIASSNPVLAAAAQSVGAVSPQALSRRVQVTAPFPDTLSISAQGKTAAQAVNTANAVTDSYVAYVSAANIPGGQVSVRVLQRAVSADKTPLLIPLLITAGIGALAGAVVGVVGLLAVKRDDRRLRLRDEIADAISIPVLASIQARHPVKAHQWAKLLDDYEPGAADAQRLRNGLDYLGLADTGPADTSSGGFFITVLSLSSDRRALALGPQLAIFAACQGIRTALVIDGQHDVRTTAALRSACALAPSSRRSSHLRVAIAEHDSSDWPEAVLTVVVTVDGSVPHVAGAIRARALVLGVSAGEATAEQLARVAASAADDNRYLAGILVADPDPADLTTGRLPQMGRRTQMPTRTSGMASVTRR